MKGELFDTETAFLLSVLCGFLLGIIYEIFRLSRIMIKQNAVLIFIEDVAYFIIAAFSFMLFGYILCDGEIRYYVLFGFFAGAYIYFITLGKYILKAATGIKNIIRKIIYAIYSALIKPLFGFFKKIIDLLFTNAKKLVIMIKSKRRKNVDSRLRKNVRKTFERGFDFRSLL